jgi:hypothetical protein
MKHFAPGAFMRVTALKLKGQYLSLPLFALLIALQLICSHTAATALAGRPPAFAIAVQQLSDDEASARFTAMLSASSSFTVHLADPNMDKQAVFDAYSVQGLVVVPADFEDRMSRNATVAVTWHAAPGISDSAVACEQVADVILQMRASTHLTEAIDALGAATITPGERSSGIISAVYDGPQILGDKTDASQVYGISALLLLLSYLHAAMTFPHRNSRRLIARGGRAWRLSWLASLLSCWLIWLVVIGAFYGILAASGIPLDLWRLCASALIIAYSSLLGALVTQFAGPQNATWAFVPFFLLNMTLGGGLWGDVVAIPALAPLIPTTAAVASGSGALLSMALLGIGSLLCLLAAILASHLRLRPHQKAAD